MGINYSKNNDLIVNQEPKYIVENGIVFLLDDKNFTASVAKTFHTGEEIIIQQYVEYNDKKYPITKINGGSFKNNSYVKKIIFPEDSELRSIGSTAFYWSTLESITIPSKVNQIGENAFYKCQKLKSINFSEKCQIRSIKKDILSNSSVENIQISSNVEEFQEGWCIGLEKLTNISISPLNQNFKKIDEKIIVGKLNKTENKFNKLIFASRDIESASIPSFIEQIDSYSFSKCKELKSIEFSNDSKLASIGKEAFSYSSIENIEIPSNVTQIGEGAFIYCQNLKSVFFNENSQIKSIGKYVFSHSSLESIQIPSNVEEFQEGWCIGLEKLTNVSISPLNQNFKKIDNKIIVGKLNKTENNFNNLIFANRDIKNITIPSYIEKIGSLSFSNCNELESIQFTKESKLVEIDKQAFARSSIKFISIPKNCQKIGEHAFSLCKKLEFIEFTDDSNIVLLDESAFSNSSIEKIIIPSNVEKIKESAFESCRKLKRVEFAKNSNLRKIKKYAFANTSLKFISIPSKVEQISENTFSRCPSLVGIEFLTDRCPRYFIQGCNNLLVVSFPFANGIPKKICPENMCSENFRVFIKTGAKIF